MWLAGLVWFTSAGAFAQDAPPPERWDDTLTLRAPTSAYVAAQGASLFGQDTVVFGDLQAGVPLRSFDNGAFTIGLGVQAQSSSIWTADGRAATGLRSVGPDLWMAFAGRERLSVHAVVVRFRSSFEGAQTRWFRTANTEIGTRLGLVYDGYVDLRHVHLSVEANLGFSTVTIVDAGATAVVLVPIGDRVALGAGVAARGAFQVLTPTVMARVRPVDGLEIGVGVARSIMWFDASPLPQPILDVKGYW